MTDVETTVLQGGVAIRHFRRAWWHLLVALFLASACGVSVAQPLQSELDQIIGGRLATCGMGVVVIDAASGRVLASHDSERRLVPASNMKLITSVAALRVLGRDFEFRTELQFDDANTRLIVRGGGDPGFGDPRLLEEMSLTPEQFVDKWVEAAAAVGVEQFDEIVVDDRVFDREWVHPSWPVEQLNRWYCAQVAGVNFHTNCLEVYLTPGGAGRAADLRVQPDSPWLGIGNKTETVTRGRHTPWASRVLGTNEITMRGDVRFSGEPVEVTLHDVPVYFAELLAHRLKIAGVGVGSVRRVGENEELEGRAIHVVRTPMSTVLRRINVNSQNMYAEALLKRMGAEVTGPPGSWNGGCAAMRSVIVDRLGPGLAQQAGVADGSGMSRDNRLTAALLAAWLRDAVNDDAIAEPLLESMASAGEGTLRRRFSGDSLASDVVAKTGYLRGISALSGVVTDEDSGRRIIVAVVTNDCERGVTIAQIRSAEESVVAMIDRWLVTEAGGIPGG